MQQYFKIEEEYQPFFAKLPLWIYKTEPYKSAFANKSEAVIVYAHYLHAYTASQRNGWKDKEGNIYITYTNNRIESETGLKSNTVTNSRKLLVDLGLLKIKKQGFKYVRDEKGKVISKVNLPDRLYLLRPVLDSTDFYSKEKSNENEVLVNKVSSDTDIIEFQSNSSLKVASDQQSSEHLTSKRYKEKKRDIKDTYKESHIDFSPKSYPQSKIDAQNRILIENAPKYMISKYSNKMIFSKKVLEVIKLWANTSKDINELGAMVLKARNSVKRKIAIDIVHLDYCKGEGLVKLQRLIQQGLFLPGHTQENDFMSHTANVTDEDIINQFLRSFKKINEYYDYDHPVKNAMGYLYESFKWLFTQKITEYLIDKVETENDKNFLLSWEEKQQPKSVEKMKISKKIVQSSERPPFGLPF